MSLLALIAAHAAGDPDPDPVPTSIHEATHRTLDWSQATTLVTLAQVTGATALREQDDVIYDPAHTDPARRWCFYFSAVIGGVSHVWVSHSPDGLSWGAPAPCTVSGSVFAGEDPSITQTFTTSPVAYRDGSGRLVLFCENNTTNVIDAYTSTDGIAWTLTQAGAIGKTAGYDDYLVGSPNARHDGSQYVVGYEGIRESPWLETFSIAWGPTPGTLTKTPNVPVINPDTTTGLSGSIVSDAFWLTPDGSAVILTAHSGLFQNTYRMWRMRTTNTDPTTWTAGDFTVIGGQMIDPTVRNDLTADLRHGRLVTAPDDDASLVSVPLVP